VFRKRKCVSITLNLFLRWKFRKIFRTLSIGTTKKDMAEMKDLFNLFDIDGNGSITQSEFRIVMESLGHSITEEQSTALVDEFDVDDTDGIEIFEFIAMIKKYQEVYKLSDYEELVKSIKLVRSNSG